MPDDSFAALFEAEAGHGPSGHRKVHVGETLEAVVVQVGRDTLFLELDGKRQAMLDRVDVQNPDGTVDVKAGDVLRAKVIEVDAQTGQVRLGRVISRHKLVEPETPGDPVAAPAGPATPTAKLATGAIVKGKVMRVERYGVFLQVEGIEGRDGRGLVPVSELNAPQGADLRKRFPEGTLLTAKVLETGDGRLKLSVRGALDAAERAEFEAHKDAAQNPASFGTFGDLIKKSKKA
jgi:small subunit ribosomal protein S1